jgi:hypothetical protein
MANKTVCLGQIRIHVFGRVELNRSCAHLPLLRLEIQV